MAMSQNSDEIHWGTQKLRGFMNVYSPIHSFRPIPRVERVGMFKKS